MFASFTTALTALRAHVTAVDVVSNNLANINTVGFKASAVSFHELARRLIGTGAAGTSQIGFGVSRPSTVRQYLQGSVQPTDSPLDGAIEGDGFFVMKDAQDRTLYTRAGNFLLDPNGILRTVTGERVQGWIAGPDGSINTNQPIGDIVIPVSLQQPIVTTQMALNLNLDATAEVGDSFSTPVQVVDSLGNVHVLTFTFTKTGQNQWDWQVTIPGESVSAGTPGTPFEVASGGPLVFGPDGRLQSPSLSDGPIQIAITGLTSGADDMSISWELYNVNGLSRLTQFAQPSAVLTVEQNGIPPGQLTRLRLENGGRIVAEYSNGQQVAMAQLALALIRNPESMISVGNSMFLPSVQTAIPAIGLPNTGGRGQVLGGHLELSTVDLAREFTNLIVYQRGYQANARVVTTADELSQETINLKR